jgi:predicted nucleic acid-binding protein
MRILIDTNILIDIDRGEPEAIELMEALTEKGADMFISTITISEFLTGIFIQEQTKKSQIINGRELLSQFKYTALDPQIAEIAGERIARRMKNELLIEYQDEIIASTAIFLKADFLLTNNKKHYTEMPETKIVDAKELIKTIKK